MNDIPDNVFINYLYKDENFVFVKDPKHNDQIFHYTIRSLNDKIKDIYNLDNKTIIDLDKFIKIIKEKNYFNNEKCILHILLLMNVYIYIYILFQKYVSYRPINQLFFMKIFII